MSASSNVLVYLRYDTGLTRHGPFSSKELAEQFAIALASNPNIMPNWSIEIKENR